MSLLGNFRIAVLIAAAAVAVYGAFSTKPRTVDYACITLLLMVCAMIIRQYT
jgi:hypothetical protein